MSSVVLPDAGTGKTERSVATLADADWGRAAPAVLVLAAGPHSITGAEDISFNLPAACSMTVRVYSVRGDLVRVLFDGRLSAGRHSVLWDGTSDRGLPVKSGLYLCRLEAPAFSESRKLLLVR